MSYDKPLSYSGLSLWKKCPLAWHDAYVLGNRRPSGSAAQRGTYLHELLEDFFKGSPFPSGNKALAPWQEFMEGLAQYGPEAEGEVAVTKDWQRCSFDDPMAYFRGKKDLSIDCGDRLMLFDWKSGKIYPEHVDQGAAYTAASPGYDRYDVFFVYLDQPHIVKHWTYDRDGWLRVQSELIESIEEVRNAEEYEASPGPQCTYCDLSWRRGGDCKRAP